MKAIAIDAFGGVNMLKMVDVPTPKPADNEVQIKINYTAVNPVDWKIREGYLSSRLPHEFPLILGWDAAGTISAIGKNVKNFKIGDEVYAYCRKPVVHWGTYAEFVCMEADKVALKPNNITFGEAAGIPLAGLTAWQALFDFANLKKGQTILIHAGSGGVGNFAIQFAKIAGATIYTTCSAANADYCKKLGADETIDYHTVNFLDALKKLCPKGLDCVFDTIGGQTLKESLDVVKEGGCIVSIVEKIDPKLAEEKKIKSGYVFVRPDGTQLSEIARLIEQKKVQPPHIEEMRLSEAAKAHDKSRNGHTKGKIVLKVNNS